MSYIIIIAIIVAVVLFFIIDNHTDTYEHFNASEMNEEAAQTVISILNDQKVFANTIVSPRTTVRTDVTADLLDTDALIVTGTLKYPTSTRDWKSPLGPAVFDQGTNKTFYMDRIFGNGNQMVCNADEYISSWNLIDAGDNWRKIEMRGVCTKIGDPTPTPPTTGRAT